METKKLAPGYIETLPLSPTPLRVSIETFRHVDDSPDPLEHEKPALELLLKNNTPITPEELTKLLLLFPEDEKVQLCNAIRWERTEYIIDIIERAYHFTVPSLHFAHNFIYKKCGKLFSDISGKYIKALSKNQGHKFDHYDKICQQLQTEGANTNFAIYNPKTPRITRKRSLSLPGPMERTKPKETSDN